MNETGSFGRLLVVEVAGSAAGSYCGKLFGDYGAEVVLVGEGPGGPGAEFYRRSKHAADEVPALAAADVVIHSSATDPPGGEAVAPGPGQVVVRISPFAAEGPYAGWRSTDLVDAAIAGHLRLSGDPDREPLQAVPDIGHHAAGVMGFIGAVAGLIARVRTGIGQIVEVSHQETLAALHQFTLCRYTHNGAILNRHGNRYAGPGSPIGAYRCADGWIGLALPQEDQLERMLEVTGLVSMLERPDVDSIWDLMTDVELLDQELVPYLLTRPRDEVVDLFQALRLPCAPIADLVDVLADAHLAARGFWHTGSGAGLRLPGPPFRLSDHRWSDGPKRQSGRLPVGSAPQDVLGDGPLTGLRVIDMTRVWAGPLAARILADLGAEVLMTEVPWTRTGREVPQSYVDGTHFFPDDAAGERPWNRSAFHNKYANNKLSTVIDLETAAGRQLLQDLVPTADLLIENYSPRVMPSFGLDEERLRSLNPDLIYVTMPGYGRAGPNTDWVAYGPTIDGHVGHSSLTGYRGEGPWKCGIAWPDPIGGMHGAAAALVALLDRLVEPDGRGQTVEVAQVEAAVNMIGQHLVAAQVDGQPPRLGNRRPGRAPQGVYRCAGPDRWIALSIVDDRSWSGLCTVLGLDDLIELDLGRRWARHDELDDRIEAVTATRDDRELMAALQAVGVPAGAALDAADVMADPQLAAIDFFVELDHADAGVHRWPRLPIRFSATPATLRRPAALMGEHNEYATRTLAGYPADRYRDLVEQQVLLTEPPA